MCERRTRTMIDPMPVHRSEETVHNRAGKAARILVVANRTASTPRLLDAVAARALDGCSFTLLIPPEKGQEDTDWTQEDALAMLARAAQMEVAYLEAGSDALDAIHRAVDAGHVDE